MKKIFIALGTRPEVIKMWPVIKEIEQRKKFEIRVCITGQHREMVQGILNSLALDVHYNLELMQENQSLFDITISILTKIKKILEDENPDLVLVHGDTTTSFSVALACYYLKIPVGHVEAGLRTYDIFSPYPEEFNRQSLAILANYHFAPTLQAKENLLKEGKPVDTVFVTGNTAIDVLRYTVYDDYIHSELEWAQDSRMVLITAHRRENIGMPMRNIFRAIKRVLEENEDVKAIYPIHMNPKVRELAKEELGGIPRLHIIEPLDVVDFHNFIAKAFLILTDSGGIQEEASALGKPVLVMRNTTERPEGIQTGTLQLVGTEEESIYKKFSEILIDKEQYTRMVLAQNPYGDGFAAKKIIDVIENILEKYIK